MGSDLGIADNATEIKHPNGIGVVIFVTKSHQSIGCIAKQAQVAHDTIRETSINQKNEQGLQRTLLFHANDDRVVFLCGELSPNWHFPLEKL